MIMYCYNYSLNSRVKNRKQDTVKTRMKEMIKYSVIVDTSFFPFFPCDPFLSKKDWMERIQLPGKQKA